MPELIDHTAALEEPLARMREAEAIALDTESDSFFAYQPKVCLIQASVPGRDFLIDPLAEGLDLAPLGEILGDGSREIILHAAENDVIQLQHQFGWRIARLFDTQVACFVLGLPPYSLAGVLEARFDVKLDKSQQRSDWSRRPLDPEQIGYAAEDTHYLLDLAEELHRRADDAGRAEEIETECRRIATRTWEPEPFDPEGFRRLSGARDLDGRALWILRELFLLRHRDAKQRNRAPYRIAQDHVLVRIAQRRIREFTKGIPTGFWHRHGDRIRGIVDKSRGQGAPQEPHRNRTRGEPLAPEIKRRYENLRRWRTGMAEERGVETWVVARNELLLRIATDNPRDLAALEPLVEPFRLEEYGGAILSVLLDSP